MRVHDDAQACHLFCEMMMPAIADIAMAVNQAIFIAIGRGAAHD